MRWLESSRGWTINEVCGKGKRAGLPTKRGRARGCREEKSNRKGRETRKRLRQDRSAGRRAAPAREHEMRQPTHGQSPSAPFACSACFAVDLPLATPPGHTHADAPMTGLHRQDTARSRVGAPKPASGQSRAAAPTGRRSAKIRPGRSGRRSSPWSRPPRSRRTNFACAVAAAHRPRPAPAAASCEPKTRSTRVPVHFSCVRLAVAAFVHAVRPRPAATPCPCRAG